MTVTAQTRGSRSHPHRHGSGQCAFTRWNHPQVQIETGSSETATRLRTDHRAAEAPCGWDRHESLSSGRLLGAAPCTRRGDRLLSAQPWSTTRCSRAVQKHIPRLPSKMAITPTQAHSTEIPLPRGPHFGDPECEPLLGSLCRLSLECCPTPGASRSTFSSGSSLPRPHDVVCLDLQQPGTRYGSSARWLQVGRPPSSLRHQAEPDARESPSRTHPSRMRYSRKSRRKGSTCI